MLRRVRFFVFGSAVLLALCALAGCAGHYLSGERAAWRHDAELQCLNSGAVKEGSGKVRITPIEGPGMCGADFPLKVSSLGNGVPLAFGDEVRPPSGIPNSGGATPPRWPIAPSQPAAAVTQNDLPPLDDGSNGPYSAPAQPGYGSPSRYQQPLSLDPPTMPNGTAQLPPTYDFRRPYGAAAAPPAPVSRVAPRPDGNPTYDYSPDPYDRREVIDGTRGAPRADPPPLGPARTGPVTAAIGPVAVSPAATLACPLVSALDQWIDDAVQPAAMKWFGQPVVEIKQISAYSCRGMNGDPNATISEHAFGNALDVAAFTLADGHKISVQYGWHGAPEEQGFLHDVQAAACDQFTTVLAPGYNAFHYNQIHVDLMRRSSGHRACQPHPIPGDEVAARARGSFAAKHFGPAVTGSLGQQGAALGPKLMRPEAFSDQRSERDVPDAVPGSDGDYER
jgi:hypothetical protein